MLTNIKVPVKNLAFRKRVIITLLQPMLGTKPIDPEVFAKYIRGLRESERPKSYELENAENLEKYLNDKENQGSSVFHRNSVTGNIVNYAYQIRGFFKAAAGAMRQADESASKGLTAYKSKISELIFVFPNEIEAILPEGGRVEICERAMRVETPQGPRNCLARSEALPIGTRMEFIVGSPATKFGKEAPVKAAEGEEPEVARPGSIRLKTNDLVEEWLNYGLLQGLGQWRNSGRGQFSWEEVPEEVTKGQFSWEEVPEEVTKG